MKVKIKKGDIYECIKNYYMSDGSLAYEKGKKYISDYDGNLPDDLLNSHNHHMDDTEDFWDHFILIEKDIGMEAIGKKDNINPDHYKQGKVECIDALESATVNKTGLEAVCTANIIKYLWRYESKNGVEDCEKAKWYLNKLINHLNTK